MFVISGSFFKLMKNVKCIAEIWQTQHITLRQHMSDNIVNGRVIELPPLTLNTDLLPDYYLYKFEDGSEYQIDQILVVVETLKDGKFKVLDYGSRQEQEIIISNLLSDTSAHWFYCDVFYRYKKASR